MHVFQLCMYRLPPAVSPDLLQVLAKLIEHSDSAFVTDFSQVLQAKNVAHHQSTVLVITYLWLQVNLVCCLLKLPDFSDDVRNLINMRKQGV